MHTELYDLCQGAEDRAVIIFKAEKTTLNVEMKTIAMVSLV